MSTTDLPFNFWDIPDGKVTIYYSANTLFWTTDPSDLKKSELGTPLDFFGSPLFQADTTKAELKQKGYSDYFKMCAHAKNLQTTFKKLVPRSNQEIRRIFSSSFEELQKEISR